MEKSHHPHRYRDKMRAAVERIEDIQRSDQTTKQPLSSRLAAEFEGLSSKELLARRSLLNHLELLIYDWQNDGGRTIEVGERDRVSKGSYSGSQHLLDALEGDIVYLHFGHLVGLELEHLRGEYVDGMYLREAYTEGKSGIEVTIVCGGQNWAKLELLPFSEALQTASRIAIGFAQLDEDFTQGLKLSALTGDFTLIDDKALIQAVEFGERILRAQATANRYRFMNQMHFQRKAG